MGKVHITGEQRREMMDAARSGKARWKNLTHQEKKEAKEYEEHMKKLAEAKKEEEREKEKIVSEQKIPVSMRVKMRLLKLLLIAAALAGIYLYLRYYQDVDAAAWLRSLVKR